MKPYLGRLLGLVARTPAGQKLWPPRIPGYKRLCKIGCGTYGDVYLVRNEILDSQLRAAKVVWPQTQWGEDFYEREVRGLQSYSSLAGTHEGLLTIWHVGQHSRLGYLYYVMDLADDWVSGRAVNPRHYRPKSLHELLAHQGALSLDECIRISQDLLEALEHLHRNNLIHRDIKPLNIIFVDGRPKLADIGLLTHVGSLSFVGTREYMPPEGPGQPTADIYSFGKVLQQMSPPGADPQSVYLRGVAAKACASLPEQRFQSASEMSRALRVLVASSASPARQPSAPSKCKTTKLI